MSEFFDIIWAEDGAFQNAVERLILLPSEEIQARGLVRMRGMRVWKDVPIPDAVTGQVTEQKGWCVMRNLPGSIPLLALPEFCTGFTLIEPGAVGAMIKPEYFESDKIKAEVRNQLAFERASLDGIRRILAERKKEREALIADAHRRYLIVCALFAGVAGAEKLGIRTLHDVQRGGVLMGKEFPDEDLWLASFTELKPAAPDELRDIRVEYNEARSAKASS